VVNETDATRTGDLPGPEEGGGPPEGLPWTLVVEDEEWSADLEHAAHVPRVGELVELITARGEHRAYRVTAVVHTVQPSASERPPVAAERTGPNATVSDLETEAPPRSLRAGLPRIFVRRET
jgi:hypothetical protein